MTDRELLEMAAKAARIEFNDKRSPTGNVALYCAGAGWWNPLTDDGDALRLAVRLKLVVECDGDKGVVVHDNITGSFSHAWERFDSDPYAATRRAITRAAAEIGKDTK
jgi:hypothetical protein